MLSLTSMEIFVVALVIVQSLMLFKLSPKGQKSIRYLSSSELIFFFLQRWFWKMRWKGMLEVCQWNNFFLSAIHLIIHNFRDIEDLSCCKKVASKVQVFFSCLFSTLIFFLTFLYDFSLNLLVQLLYIRLDLPRSPFGRILSISNPFTLLSKPILAQIRNWSLETQALEYGQMLVSFDLCLQPIFSR